MFAWLFHPLRVSSSETSYTSPMTERIEEHNVTSNPSRASKHHVLLGALRMSMFQAAFVAMASPRP